MSPSMGADRIFKDLTYAFHGLETASLRSLLLLPPVLLRLAPGPHGRGRRVDCKPFSLPCHLDGLTMSGEESSEDDQYVDVICCDRTEVTGELSKINLGSVQHGKSSARDHVWLASRFASLSGTARINILPSFRTAARPLPSISRPRYCRTTALNLAPQHLGQVQPNPICCIFNLPIGCRGSLYSTFQSCLFACAFLSFAFVQSP